MEVGVQEVGVYELWEVCDSDEADLPRNVSASAHAQTESGLANLVSCAATTQHFLQKRGTLSGAQPFPMQVFSSTCFATFIVGSKINIDM